MLIAELGNNHFGNLDEAKRMILAARDHGADLVKMQAIDETCRGSMMPGFYSKVQFTTREYLDLIHFAWGKGIILFYSVFSPKHEAIYAHQKFFKVPGSTSRSYAEEWSKNIAGNIESSPKLKEAECSDNGLNVFISFPPDLIFMATRFPKWMPLYVSPYMSADPLLYHLEYLKRIFGGNKAFGYSDHYIGTDAVEVAIKGYGATIIEKHFCLKKNQSWGGQVFRDTIHGATPHELERIAKWLQ